MKKRAVSLLLALAMVVSLLDVTVLPAQAADVSVSVWSDLKAGLEAGNTVKLTADVVAQGTVSLGKNTVATLDLNGHKLDLNGANGFTVEDGATLTIRDSAPNGGPHSITDARDGSSADVTGGVITGGNDTAASAKVFEVRGSGALCLESGSIAGNRADYLIRLDGAGRFAVSGGAIEKNVGNITFNSSQSLFAMSGGRICYNRGSGAAPAYIGPTLLNYGEVNSKNYQLSGTVLISENEDENQKPGNLAIRNVKTGPQVIEFPSELSAGSRVGLSPTENDSPFAIGWQTGWSDPTGIFSSDYTPSAGGFHIHLTSDGKLYHRQDTGKVVYLNNGGTGGVQEQTVTLGEAAKLTANAFTRTDHTFDGWNTKPDGSGTAYADQQTLTLTDDLTVPEVRLTLYAQWKAASATVTVTFDANNGGSGTKTYELARDTAVPLPANTFTRAGYTFRRWNTKKDGSGTDYADAQIVTLNANLSLYAIWGPIITFHANDGTGRKFIQSVPSGMSTTLSQNPYSRRGVEFTGWTTGSDGGGTKYSNQQSVTISEDIDLYAQWYAHKYTVVFDGNGGWSNREMDDQVFYCGESQRLRYNTYENGDLKFAGWALRPDDSADYSDHESVQDLSTTDGDTVTLYAVWRSNQPSAQVRLVRGNTTYGRESLQLGDQYRFSSRSGAYNIVTTSGSKTLTTYAYVDKEDVVGIADVPDASVNSILTTRSGAEDVVVGNLDEAAYDERRSGYTVTLKMTVEKLNESTVNSQHKAIRAVSGDGTLDFYDFTLTKTLSSSSDRNFNGELEDNLLLFVPLRRSSAKEVTVYRYHNSTVDVLTMDNSREEYVEIRDSMAVIHARKFSIFALGYTGAAESTSPSATNQNGATSQTATPTYVSTASSCPRGYSCPMSVFYDAAPTAWFHDGVHWALEQNAMQGYSAHMFKPDDRMTRAQLVTMLWRLAGRPVSTMQLGYEDVPWNSWYTEAVRWATEYGITTGRSGRSFAPNETMTREELAAVLYRYAQRRVGAQTDEVITLLQFVDASDISPWAYDAMCYLSRNGVFEGTTSYYGRLLEPKSTATRAQTATVMMRFWQSLGR